MALGVIFFALILTTASLFYLLYCIAPGGSGPLSKARRFALVSLPTILAVGLERTLGPKALALLARVRDYVFFENNSIVMGLYFLIGPGGYLLYVYEVLIPFHSDISWAHLVFGNLLAGFAFWTYWKTFSTPNKQITDENVQEKCKEYAAFEDGEFYVKHAFCEGCGRARPARAKHCRLCGVCVVRHDHHCIW